MRNPADLKESDIPSKGVQQLLSMLSSRVANHGGQRRREEYVKEV